jgi:nucleoid-associated protein YgaU
LAAVVLIGGIALAWQFRRPGGDATGDSMPGKPLAATHVAATDSAGNSGAIVASRETSAQAAPVASTTEATPGKGSDDPSVPALPRAFGSASGAGDAPLGADAAASTSPRLGSLSGIDQGPTHRVTDGDTLTDLAKRYLGNPNRWNELYDYNRDVLTNPDLLPIGADLRIPTAPYRPTSTDAASGGAPETTPARTARPVSQSGGGPASQSSSADMVPVGSGTPGVDNPAPTTGGPSAKLRRLPPVLPEPTGHLMRLAPRTYVVQPGDTLSSVAEQLYGDGARENVLRDANRNLQGQQYLRPGTVLVIPMANR